MSRAAILPTPGDPFLLNLWLKFYEQRWAGEINQLYIVANNNHSPEWMDYMRKRVAQAPNALMIHVDHQIEHGDAIKLGLGYVKEDFVMLAEDDGIIFKSGMVDMCFKALESNQFDVVGSPRGSCGMQILQLAKAKWGLDYEGVGDLGPNFWPCYFFTSTALLRQIDHYGAKLWPAGSVIEPFGVAAETDQAGDTFVAASLQIRTITPKNRIKIVPQYHLHPEDFAHSVHGQSIWDGKAGWLHIGSLSSGYMKMLDASTPLQCPTPTNDFERKEYERRVQWWLTALEKRDVNELVHEADGYKQGIDRVVNELGLRQKYIMQRQRITREVLGDI